MLMHPERETANLGQLLSVLRRLLGSTTLDTKEALEPIKFSWLHRIKIARDLSAAPQALTLCID